MARPRTKLGRGKTLLQEDVAKWVGDCRECQSFWEWWENWRPRKGQRRGFEGRPKFVVEPQALHQGVLFASVWLTHLREQEQIPEYGAGRHLIETNLSEWVPAVEKLRPYFRCKDAAWGEPWVISARRWRGDGEYQGDVQYHAVRRLLAERLDISPKSLLRRFDELALWGPAA